MPAMARAETWREQSQKDFEARGLRGVKIENGRGSITVRRGASDRVRLTALKIVRGNDREQALGFSGSTKVTVGKDSDRLAIKVLYPQRQSVRVSFIDMFGDYQVPRVEVRLIVDVPAEFAAELRSTSADLVTEDLSGSQTLNTTSGDVSVRGSRAPIHVRTTSGDISASAVGRARFETESGNVDADGARGPIRAGSTSGNVSVQGAEDSVRVTSVSGNLQVDVAPHGLLARTTSGEIRVQEARGAVRLESSSGGIRVGLASPLTAADISTVSGDVSAALLGPVGVSLEMRTTNGAIDLSAPLEVKTVSRRVVAGLIGDGKAPVSLRSSSGDIHLSSGENP
jgi:DUF4097 and DUF4098 domain-containing protein YvlB